jgi:murein DD-endopeptidase MepM/ murein hydrolase activator NlpD
MSGPDVAALQHALKKRRHRLAVDAEFGPRTKRAVIRQQKRFGMRPTGVADAKLQRRLRIKPRYRAAAFAPSNVGAQFLREFPVRGDYTYTNDFGAPRHQGRHEGIDIIARRGSPVVAAAAGEIESLSRKETGLGGIWIWLRDAKGNTHYYAHLESIVAGLKQGSPVQAGQVIGGVGNTGDARSTLPHLHFELHPGDGPAISPYRELRAVDPKAPKLKRR